MASTCGYMGTGLSQPDGQAEILFEMVEKPKATNSAPGLTLALKVGLMH